jgi:hypothetical protein
MSTTSLFWGANYDWTTGPQSDRTAKRLAFESKYDSLGIHTEIECYQGTLYASQELLNSLLNAGVLQLLREELVLSTNVVVGYRGVLKLNRIINDESYLDVLARMDVDIMGYWI